MKNARITRPPGHPPFRLAGLSRASCPTAGRTAAEPPTPIRGSADGAVGSSACVTASLRVSLLSAVTSAVAPHRLRNEPLTAAGRSRPVLHDGVVTCPGHGSRLRLTDGACLLGPATFPQLRLEARVQKGEVEVRGRKG